MARKRGGLAGLYDKTKPFLRVAAPIALGAIPGVGVPLAVAAGAAMGADTEGRKLLDWRNVGGAITGGLAGYTGGKMGESIRQTVQNRVKDLLTARARSKGLEAGTKALEGFQMPDLTDYNALPDVGLRQRGIFEGLTGEGGAPVTSRLTTAAAPKAAAARPTVGRAGNIPRPMNTAPQLTMSQAAAPPSMVTSVSPSMTTAQSLLAPMAPPPSPTVPPPTTPPPAANPPMRFRQAMYQPQVLAGIAQGAIGQLPSAQTAALNAQTELARQQFEENKRQAQLEEERRRRIAELLMPYAMQNFPQYFGGR